MTRNKFVTVALGSLIFASTAVAQTTTALQGEALLNALLEEIRLLRTTIQRNSAVELRARVLLERMRMQQEIVRELRRGSEDRQMEAAHRMEMDPFEEETANLEIRLKEAIDPTTRRQIEAEMRGMAKRREMFERNQARVEAHFLRQEQRLAEETARLRGIEDELQRLEQALSTAPIAPASN